MVINKEGVLQIIQVMKTLTEKEKFSNRLNLALDSVFQRTLKSSEIATKFNLRYPNGSVTQQAVYKWVNGLAIPSDDKIETLAKWLDVNPEWLRYGVSDENRLWESCSEYDEVLLRLIQPLSQEEKKALVQVITAFKKP